MSRMSFGAAVFVESQGMNGTGFPRSVQLEQGRKGNSFGIPFQTTELGDSATTPLIFGFVEASNRASSAPRDAPMTTMRSEWICGLCCIHSMALSKYSRGMDCKLSGKPFSLKYASARVG